MRRLPILLLTLALFAACSAPQKGGCTIKGVISAEDKRDSCYIFLVPQGPHEASDVDSTLILNGAFEFTAEKEQMAIIRVTKYRRLGLQDLLVVTEPGTVNVTIAASSQCSGTPQNDSLQVWKELTEAVNAQKTGARDKGERDEIHNAYKQRSQQIAHNCGDDTTLGRFLLGLYPEKK